MYQADQIAMHRFDEDEALQIILEGTAATTGESFFAALVKNLSKALDTHGAWVTEYIEEFRRLRALAFWAAGKLVPDFAFDIAGTPCEAVIESAGLVHYPDNVLEIYPENRLLKRFYAVSYMGVPLFDSQSRIIGHLAVLDTRPMPREPRGHAIIRIFAARASAELQRLRAEREIRAREEKYRRIVETAGEGFLLMDREYRITDVNQVFCEMSGYERHEIIGQTPVRFTSANVGDFLRTNRKSIFSGEVEAFESTLVNREGRHVPVLVHAGKVTDDRGEVIGKTAFISDMTEHKKSLLLAAETQKGLMPRARPRIDGIDVDGRNVSCEEVGGDYYDFFHDHLRGDRRLGVVVGDVMGHGIDAALIMTAARTFLHISDRPCEHPAGTVAELNRHLILDVLNASGFMTLFFMNIDPARETIRWVRAGHEPALLYDPERDRFTELKGPGMALGIDEDYEFVENKITGVKKGQIIAIGTDGIWEATDRNGSMFGKRRFREVIRANARLGATCIIDAVFNSLHAFTAGQRRQDDVTLVLVKIGEKNKP